MKSATGRNADRQDRHYGSYSVYTVEKKKMKKSFYHILLQFLLAALFASAASAGFTLQLGSFLLKHNAEKCVNDLSRYNYKAFIHTQESRLPGKGLWYKVRIGPFSTFEEAFSRKQAIRDAGFSNNIVIVKTEENKTSSGLKTNKKDKTARSNRSSVAPAPAKKVNKAYRSASRNRRDVTLAWDKSKKPDCAGYKIYYDTDPGKPYEPDKADWADEGGPPIIVRKNVSKITLHGLSTKKDYYLTITSFSTKTGRESPFSNEVVFPATERAQEPEPKPKPEEKPAEYKKGPTSEMLPFLPGKTDSRGGAEDKPPRPDKTAESEEAGGVTLLNPGDVLEIEVPGQADMSQTYDVDPSGNIYMMGVGKIETTGLDLNAMTQVVEKKVAKYTQKGERVKVKIVERSCYIQIKGGIRFPGWYRAPKVTTLDELIMMSGGLLSGSDYSGVILKRKTKDGFMEIGVKGNIELETNDILEVPFPKMYRSRIDSGDLVFVRVPEKQAPQRSINIESVEIARLTQMNQVEIDRNGYLIVPKYGHFFVKGKTTEEIKKLIISKLPKYLQRTSDVEINLIEKKHYVEVLGHVGKPGRYNIPENSNVQAAINAAGGAIDGAILSDISIKREWGGKLHSVKVNLYQYTITGDPRLLTPVNENDTIFVPISSSFGNVKRTLHPWNPPEEKLEKDTKSKVRIFGAVRNPGFYEPYEGMDLLDLMVLCSGEDEGADLSKVLIIRNKRIEEEFNLQKFIENRGAAKGHLKVPQIHPGDTVYVKYLELKIYEPKEDKVIYVTGKVRRPGQYKLWDNMTVLQAIALAGGLDEWADSEHMTIVRMVAGKQENIPYNFRKGVSGKLPELNIYLEADDTIIVP